jgi:hypothetical protein
MGKLHDGEGMNRQKSRADTCNSVTSVTLASIIVQTSLNAMKSEV